VALRGNVFQWWHFIAQTTIVASGFTAAELANKLNPHIDPQVDHLLVVEIKPHEFEGWLPREAWDWLHQVSNSMEPRTNPALTS
jgi:hypothetical protein